MSVIWFEDANLVDVATHQLFFQPDRSQFRCEPMLWRRQFMETTSKYWALWSLFLVCCPSRMRQVNYCWVPLLRDTWPVYFFLYWGCCDESANPGLNQKTRKKRANLVEQVYVLYLWIWPVSVPVCLKWLYLSVCMFYSFTSTFVLTCTVAVFLSAIWEISLNCYHYYCISIVLLKIWHVVH